MQLSEHFTLSELTHSQTASRLGLDNTPSASVAASLLRTAIGLERIRKLVGKPIVVSSGYRSPLVNKAVGGAANSQHTLGQAADITCPGYGTPAALMALVVKSGIDYDQAILEFASNGGGWLHVSFTSTPRKQALVIDHDGTRAYA